MSIKRFCFVIILSFLGAVFFTAYIMLPAIDQNSQQEYCIYTAYTASSFNSVDIPEKAYVRRSGRYSLYKNGDELAYKVFYRERIGAPCPITESDWEAQSAPCKLRQEAFTESRRIFAFSYVFLTALMLGISLLVSLAWKGLVKIFKRMSKEV